jgi:hypothetical protein
MPRRRITAGRNKTPSMMAAADMAIASQDENVGHGVFGV